MKTTQRLRRLTNSQKIWLLVFIVAFSSGLYHAGSVGDTFWSLRAGQDLFHLRDIWLNRYSFEASNVYWPNHEWLWEGILYALYWLGHRTFLIPIIVNSVLWAFTFCLSLPSEKMLATLGKRRSYGDLCFLIVAAVLFEGIFDSIRAETTSFFFLALYIYLVRRDRYKAIPFLTLLWANLHAQVFTGIMVLGMALLMTFIVKDGRELWRRKKVLTTLLWSLGATLCTPLTYRLWLYILNSLLHKPGSGIEEYQPFWVSTFLSTSVMILVVLSAYSIRRISTKHKADWSLMGMLPMVAIFFFMSCSAIRSTPLFLVAILPYFMLSVSAPQSLKFKNDLGPRLGPLAYISFAALALFMGLRVLPSNVHISDNQMTPRDVQVFYSCKGAELNDYNDGGFLIWYAPKRKVFFDNRYDPYPASIRNTISDSFTRGDFINLVHKYNFQCAFLDSPYSSGYITLRSLGWRQTYYDHLDGFVFLVSPAYYKKYSPKG